MIGCGDSLVDSVDGVFDLGSGLGCAQNVAGEDGAYHCVYGGFEVGFGVDFSAFDASLEDCYGVFSSGSHDAVSEEFE